MNQWDEGVKGHRIWADMQSLGPAIDDALRVDDSSPDKLPGLERIRASLAFCGKRLAAADPFVTPVGLLDIAANGIAAARNELVAYSKDSQMVHIVGANGAMDGALPALAQVPAISSPAELEAVISSAVQYRDAVERDRQVAAGLIQKLSANVSSIDSQVAELSRSVSTERQRISDLVTGYQTTFAHGQESRGKEFSESIQRAQQEFNKLIADYQGQFSTGQDARSKEFTEAQGKRQDSFGALVAEYEKKLANQDAEFTRLRSEMLTAGQKRLLDLDNVFREEAQAILDDVNAKKEHVEKLVGVIGNLGVTSGYLRAANFARKAMWLWQGLTIISLSLLTWLAYKTLSVLEDQSGHFSWGGFAARVLLLGSLGVIAAYSGSQADKLYSEEKRNRKLALELEAIGPYLAPLPIEDQNKFRVQIGERSFGREHDLDRAIHTKSPVSLVDVLKSKESKDLIDLVIELAKKAK